MREASAGTRLKLSRPGAEAAAAASRDDVRCRTSFAVDPCGLAGWEGPALLTLGDRLGGQGQRYLHQRGIVCARTGTGYLLNPLSTGSRLTPQSRPHDPTGAVGFQWVGLLLPGSFGTSSTAHATAGEVSSTEETLMGAEREAPLAVQHWPGIDWHWAALNQSCVPEGSFSQETAAWSVIA